MKKALKGKTFPFQEISSPLFKLNYVEKIDLEDDPEHEKNARLIENHRKLLRDKHIKNSTKVNIDGIEYYFSNSQWTELDDNNLPFIQTAENVKDDIEKCRKYLTDGYAVLIKLDSN